MREFSQKRKIRRILYSPLVLIILTVILFFIVKGSFGVYQKYSFSKGELRKIENDLVVLQNKKTDIDKKISHLETETGIEKELRSKFDVAREGEMRIVIVEDEKEQEVVVEKKNFLANIFTTIGGWFQ